MQRSKASDAALSRELGINIKTVAKWRERVGEARMGPGEVRSTALGPEGKAAAVAFRRRTLLPLEFKRPGIDPGDRLQRGTACMHFSPRSRT